MQVGGGRDRRQERGSTVVPGDHRRPVADRHGTGVSSDSEV